MTHRRIDSHSRSNQQRINEMIRVPQVRVISAEGEQLGILGTPEALAAARTAGLDLVEVAPEAKPPVCRIMDYGKFKYQQKRKLTKQKATHQSKLKEIRVRPKTGEHDLMVKVGKARDFLLDKDKVLLLVTFKGRELAHTEEGFKVINEVIAKLEDLCKIESPAKQLGKRIVCTLAPK